MKKMLECFFDFLLSRNRTLMIMKNLVLFLFLSLQLSANVVGQKVNLKLDNVSLNECLKAIEEQTNLGFLYNGRELSQIEGISIDVKDIEVTDVLKQLLLEQGFDFSIQNDVILISKSKLTPEKKKTQQPEKKILIRGTVKDEAGDPIVGASVYVKDGSSGAITDANGNFTLPILEGSEKLMVSFIGMITQELVIGENRFFNLVLERNLEELGDVVINGYFSRKAESYTGTATIAKQADLQKMGVDNVVESLSLIDPAFLILENNEFGSDPNRMPEINLRGSAILDAPGLEAVSRSNLTGNPNQPIFIMDNFETTLERVMDMDMNRVESITILKDASATAIYGSRAANGVVVIKTIQPKTGKMQVSYNVNTDFSFPDLDSYDLLNGQELFDLQREIKAFHYDDSERFQTYGIEKLLAQGTNTDWLAQPVRNAVGHKHSLNLMGGDERMRYMVDLNYADRKGVMKGSDRENIGLAVTLHYNLNDKFVFRNRLSVDRSKSTDSPYGSFDTYARMQPYFPIQDESGNTPSEYTYYSDYRKQRNRYHIYNPMYEAKVGNIDEGKYVDITNNFQLDWNITSDFRWKNSISYTYINTKTDQFTSPTSQEFINLSGYYNEDAGFYRFTDEQYERFNVNSVLSYSKEFSGHFVNISAGFNAMETSSRLKGFTAQGFADSELADPAYAKGYKIGGVPITGEGKTRLMGALANVNYSYNNRYLFDFSYRLDGSSQFGNESKTANFYSVGLGWNLHNESFMKDNTIISRLRLRGTYGETGSVNFAPYQAKNIVNYYKTVRNTGLLGTYLKGIGNENLRWQTTENSELAIEFGFFNNTFTGYVNYYEKKTVDMVTPITAPPSLGFTSYTGNLGEIMNKGLEFNLRVNLLKQKDWRWNVYANGVHNTSELLSIGSSLEEYNKYSQSSGFTDKEKEEDDYHLAGGGQKQASHTFRTQFVEGGSRTAIYAVRSLGIDPMTGQELFLTKDGIETFNWDTADKVVVGDEEPTLRGTFGTSFGYKQLDVNLTFRYQFGGQVYNSTLVDKIENSNKYYNVDRRVLEETWRQPGDVVQYKMNVDPSYPYSYLATYTGISSRFVQDYDLLELSAINVNYNLPKAFSQKLKMESMRLSFNMNDIFYWSTVKRERGTSYPYARSFTLGLRANF